jgi:hypothetical protein
MEPIDGGRAVQHTRMAILCHPTNSQMGKGTLQRRRHRRSVDNITHRRDFENQQSLNSVQIQMIGHAFVPPASNRGTPGRGRSLNYSLTHPEGDFLLAIPVEIAYWAGIGREMGYNRSG